jgi:hypothetical protein
MHIYIHVYTHTQLTVVFRIFCKSLTTTIIIIIIIIMTLKVIFVIQEYFIDS